MMWPLLPHAVLFALSLLLLFVDFLLFRHRIRAQQREAMEKQRLTIFFPKRPIGLASTFRALQGQTSNRLAAHTSPNCSKLIVPPKRQGKPSAISLTEAPNGRGSKFYNTPSGREEDRVTTNRSVRKLPPLTAVRSLNLSSTQPLQPDPVNRIQLHENVEEQPNPILFAPQSAVNATVSEESFPNDHRVQLPHLPADSRIDVESLSPHTNLSTTEKCEKYSKETYVQFSSPSFDDRHVLSRNIPKESEFLSDDDGNIKMLVDRAFISSTHIHELSNAGVLDSQDVLHSSVPVPTSGAKRLRRHKKRKERHESEQQHSSKGDDASQMCE